MSAASAASGVLPGAPPSPSWLLPSHVQVSVVEARALRAKGGPAAGDAFVVALQLGRQRLRTGLARHQQPKKPGGGGGGGGPRWAEEGLVLELPPLLPAPPPEALLLQLTVWQRALVGPDRFLGRAALPLDTLLLQPQGGGRGAHPHHHPERWYKLQSKPGKKEKDRGEIKVSLQFTRHSLTASMFDLSVKDKPRSPFRKLKDKVRGRQKYDLESSSAIVPSSSGALDDDDDSLDLGVQKGKAKGSSFFFRNKLRKSSLTQSNTSLGSDSTLSSVGSAAGTGMPERMTHSPSRHSSLSMEHSGRDFLPSPKLTHKRAFSDEVFQVKVLSESKSVQSVKPQKEPISRSSLCINGSHIYCEEESSPKKPPFPSSAPPQPSPFPPLQSITPKPEEEEGGPDGRPPGLPPEPDLPPWPSSSSSRSSSSSSGFQKGPPKEPPRFIPSPPILAAQEEDKLSVKTIALNKHRGRVKREEESLRAAAASQGKPVQIATPIVFPAEVIRVRPQEEAPKQEVVVEEEEEEEKKKRSRSGFFFRQRSSKDGRRSSSSSSTGVEVSPSPSAAAAEEAQRQEKSRSRSSSSGSWFGPVETKDPPQRPSSPPGLLATTDFTTDPAFSEDCGPSPFGKSQPEAAPPQHSDSEPPSAAATKPPSEWDDNFDAFATSRLRPESGGSGPPPSPPGLGATGVGSLEGTGPSETERGGGHFCGTTEDEGEGLCFGSPDLLNFGPEERGAGGSQDRDSGEASLPRGVACEEDSAPESPTGAKQAGGQPWGDLEAEEAQGTPWRRERRQSSERMSAVVLGRAPERDTVRRPSAVAVATASFPSSAVLFQEEGEAARAGGTELAQPAITSWLRGRSQSASEADRGAPLLAGLRPEGAESQEEEEEEDLGPIPSGPGEANLPVGPDAREEEEVEEEEHGMISEVQEEQGGSGGQRAGTPPPKPPRKLTGFSLEEEGSQAVWGSLEKGEEGAAPCHLPDVAQARPSMGGEAKPPLATATPTPLTPKAMPGEAVGQGGRLAPQDGSMAPADQLALAFEACPPSQYFMGGFSGAQEKAALSSEEEEEEEEGPSSSSRLTPPTLAVRLPALPEAFQTAKELPRQEEEEEEEEEGASGARPSSRAPHQAPCLTPSLLFWTALEEQQLQTPLDRRPEPERLGEEGPPPPPPPPGLRAGEALGPSAPPFAPSPYPELLAGKGMLRARHPEGSGSELGLPSSWPGDWALDFRKADFWQAGQPEGQQRNSGPAHSPAMTPGNPFAPWTGPPPLPPSPQNNPFVERPPDVLPSPAAALPPFLADRDLPRGFGGVPAEAATPLGLFLAHPSEEQANRAAPALLGNRPLAFSTPFLQAALLRPKEFSFPSPVVGLVGAGGGPAAQAPHALSQPSAEVSTPSLSSVEAQQVEEASLRETASPHLVKPISSSSSTPGAEVGSQEQEQEVAASLTPARRSTTTTTTPKPWEKKLQPTPERSSSTSRHTDSPTLSLQLEKAESKRDPSPTLDPSAKYYHLTHEELIQLLLKREAELSKKQDRVQELETYIDRLLVRIMEHSPTLLQVPLGEGEGEAEAATTK